MEALRRASQVFSPRARSVRIALNTWTGVMVQRRALQRAVAALVHSGLHRGFTTWSSVASTAAEQRARSEDCLRAVVHTLQHRGIRRALSTWMGVAVERSESQRRL